MRRGVATRLVALLAALGAGLAGCGVEVPDDVAADVRTSSTTEPGAPPTTETPRSDDELEQALIDNGYSLAEAECGAGRLRDALDDDEIATIVDADTIEDISASTARAFADALRPCVEDGAGTDEPDQPDEPDEPDGGGGIGGMPGAGDDSEGDVSRSRFLAALISGGIPDGQARCIVERLYDELDQDEINDLFHAETEADVPDDLLDAFMDIVEACE
ncbi:MAG TPA: hypothetical protein VFU19_10350 [Iamia sp.]|nr:hypothetical protein [Iamia sp.]